MTDERYILDDAADSVEGRRLQLLCQIYDPPTQELIGSKVSLAGARVLEVGAGSGTIAAWLAEQVGPDGHVVATDTNTRFLTELEGPNLSVKTHDIVAEDIADGPYDLIHCRFLLEHNFQQASAIVAKMIGALAPGGWLIAEEADHGTTRAATPDHPHIRDGEDTVVQAGSDTDRPPSSVETSTTGPAAQLPPILAGPLTDGPNSAEGEVWLLEELVGIDVDVVADWAEASGLRLLVAHDDRPDLPRPARHLNLDPDRLYVRATDNTITEAALG